MISSRSPLAAATSGADHWRSVAVRALGFVADDRLELDRFLARAGLSRADLLQRPVATTHLTAVLDFLITNETALQKFARKVDLPMEAAYEARRALAVVPEASRSAIRE